MASTISAGTTAGSAIAITGDTTGNLELKTQAGANTITVPNSTGTMMVSGNMPAFSASLASGQSITSSVYTKVLFDTELFDTNNNFASSRFTPTVAGYYQVNLMTVGQTTTTAVFSNIYKNGSNYKGVGITASSPYVLASCIVYLNGTTDYIEGYTYMVGTTPIVSTVSYFDACLVRAA